MKLIATDLDGTLLNEEGEISKENVEAIKKAMNLGIKFVVATGRSFKAAQKPLQAAGLNAPIICLNGAKVYDEKQNIITSVPLNKETCEHVFSICNEFDMYVEFFTNKGTYSGSRAYFKQVMADVLRTANPHVTDEEVEERVSMRFQEEDVDFLEDYDVIFQDASIEVFKMLGFSLEKAKLQGAYTQLIKQPGVTITSSGNINVEINHPYAKKGIALKQVAQAYGIDMKDIMALGDNLNDKSMLEAVGRGVAMGNAAPEIKEVCKYSTLTNNEHGVGYAIEEMLQEFYP
ncbi:Cof-type HAD-IIB family hydrolase [Salirhabdus sp. Marseille-P4669]|uniref:Cof-type HAD-IIB family hydrolase n=1 Tax=Salirhabdus sp. Marseille-P4669 TaxID=2042310 RepID=UPI000C7B7AB9|nr:Cof-type HAD-IIB family hydrolase [Salirhabdus sp. Marseille-P4669]